MPATIGDDNTATIHVTGAEADGAFPEGYRFLGWYTDDGNGNEVRISQERDYKLTGVDLGTQHVYTARFEYRVQFWLPQKMRSLEAASDFGFSFIKKVAEVYVRYDTKLFSSEWESDYINSSVYQCALSNASGYRWEFAAWTDDAIRSEDDGTPKIYEQKNSGSSYAKLIASADEIKYDIGSTVTAPLELSGLWKHPDIYAQRSAYVCTDFPYSALVEQTNVTGSDNRTVTAHLNPGYNFAFWNMYGVATDNAINPTIHEKYAVFGGTNESDLSYDQSTASVTWATKRTTSADVTVINYTHYYIAHNTADVNFHTADGALIQKATVSAADFPYLAADKPVTVTRRYQSPVFGEANNTYSGDGGEETVLTTGSVTDGVYTYESAEPGHSYLFTAYYEPYVVVFHKNGLTETETQLYNRYDHIRSTPLPTVQYTDGRLVSRSSSYHLTGDKPYEPTVYTARYIRVYKVVYHGVDGGVLEMEYVYADDDHAFVKEQTLTKDDGTTVTETALYNPSPFYAVHEQLSASQSFDTWLWIDAAGGQTAFADFCERTVIAGCIGKDALVGAREMHLYPVVWTLSARDSGDAPAYLRAAVTVSWRNAGGALLSAAPAEGEDYSLTMGSAWMQGADGFWYYPQPGERGRPAPRHARVARQPRPPRMVLSGRAGGDEQPRLHPPRRSRAVDRPHAPARLENAGNMIKAPRRQTRMGPVCGGFSVSKNSYELRF